MPLPFSHLSRLLAGLALLFVAVTATRGQDEGDGVTITTASGETLTLSGASTNSGNTTINTGNANATDLQKVIQDQGINYVETAQAGITLSGYVDTSFSTIYAGTITLSPSNDSTLNLSGATLTTTNILTSPLTISSGTLGPGVPLILGGNIASSLSPNSTLNFFVPSVEVAVVYTNLNVAGTLNLTVPDAASLTQLNSSSWFGLMTSSAPITGQFSNVASGARLTTTDGSGSFLVTYSGTELIVSDFEPTDGFGGVYIGNGWEASPWFGIYYPSDNSWVYHQQLGYVYVDPTDPTSLYFQNGNLGWCYTTSDTFPEVYSYQENAWLQYLPGTTMFYNYSTGLWETY